MTDIPVNASAFGNEPIASADGSFAIPTTAEDARGYLERLRNNPAFVERMTPSPFNREAQKCVDLVRALEMVGQRDRGERAAQAEAVRLAENARREKAEAAPLAEKLGIYFPVRS